MSNPVILALIFGLLCFAQAALLYVPYPSRWNFPAHAAVSLGVTCFILPVLDREIISSEYIDAARLAVLIAVASLPCYFIGLLLGGRVQLRALDLMFPIQDALRDQFSTEIYAKRTRMALLLSVLCVGGCFIRMGFAPLLADDPFSAKYFRGDYQESYDDVAVIFRTAMQGVKTITPAAYAVSITTGCYSVLPIWLGALGMLLLNMTRGVLGMTIIWSNAPFILRARSGGTILLILMIFACAAGALANGPIKYLIGKISFDELMDADALAKNFSHGASDISETVQFLRMFEIHQEWTYGRTFVGALVPYRYEWNPSVYGLSVLISGRAGNDVSGFVSGGIRLPMSIWGYAAFSYMGVVLLSFVVGGLHGTMLSRLQFHMNGLDFLGKVFVSLSFLGTSTLIWAPYWLSIYNIPPLLIWIAILRTPPLRIVGRLYI